MGEYTVVLMLVDFPGHIWQVPVRQHVSAVAPGAAILIPWCGANVGPLQLECPLAGPASLQKNGKEWWEGHQSESSFVAYKRTRAPEEGGDPQEGPWNNLCTSELPFFMSPSCGGESAGQGDRTGRCVNAQTGNPGR